MWIVLSNTTIGMLLATVNAIGMRVGQGIGGAQAPAVRPARAAPRREGGLAR